MTPTSQASRILTLYRTGATRDEIVTKTGLTRDNVTQLIYRLRGRGHIPPLAPFNLEGSMRFCTVLRLLNNEEKIWLRKQLSPSLTLNLFLLALIRDAIADDSNEKDKP